jgi:hypothetical protein
MILAVKQYSDMCAADWVGAVVGRTKTKLQGCGAGKSAGGWKGRGTVQSCSAAGGGRGIIMKSQTLRRVWTSTMFDKGSSGRGCPG